MTEPLLPNFYDVGTISVENGETAFTVTDGNPEAWLGDMLFLPSQPLVPAQRIASYTGGVGQLAFAWPGTDESDVPYEIRYTGIIERSTAQSRRVLEQLGDVKAWFDISVADDAARLALDTETNPLRAGFRVLVVEDNVIWVKATGAYGDWSGPVEFRGETGNKGDLGPPGVTPRGGYDGATAYAEGDAVLSGGSSWVALQATTGNAPPTLPTTSNAYWQLLARQGIDGAGTVNSVVAGDGVSVDDTDPTAPVVRATPSPPVLNGAVRNIKQISKAMRSGAAKAVFVGDSIFRGLSQISYGDSPVGLVTDHIRNNIPSVAWTFENYAIDGTGVGNYVNPSYNGTSAAGPAMSPPNYQLWPNGDTPTKPWRDFAKDAAPDLLIIGFGMNTSIDEGASAGALNSIIDYVETWGKVPSIVIVTPMLSSRTNGGGSPWEYVQAAADAWRGVAEQRNVSLVDPNALYRLLLDGVDIQRTPKRRRTFANFSDWLTKSGTRPSVSGSTMTFAATGWVENPEIVSNFDITATFNMDGTDICDLSYRYQDASIAVNDGYIVRVVHNSGGSTVQWYGPGNALIHSQAQAASASYKVHIEAIGTKHSIWVNNIKLALPNNGLHYGQLYPGRVGLAFAQGAGTVTAYDARLGTAKVYGGPRHTEADLLGINDWASNLDSIGGNAINHPSVIASLLVYFAAFRPLLDALAAVVKPQLPSAIVEKTAETTTSWTTNDYIDALIAGGGPQQVSFVGGADNSWFGSSHNVRLLTGVSSAVISGRKNGTGFITHTLTFPHVGNWLVVSALSVSRSTGGSRNVLTSWAIEVQ